MSSLRDKVSKNFSQSKKTEFERRVNELSGAMSEMAAIQLVLGEMFREGKENGGIMSGVSDEIKDPIIRKLKVLPDTLDKISKKIAPLLGFEPKEIERLLEEEKRKRSKKAEGGIMDLGGMEMDLRGGGFVPLGAKEKADDVPARLSKNEFVMTADAVRAAGGGSVDKVADLMYKTMKQLEDRVA